MRTTVCYVCEKSKKELESQGQNFEVHVNQQHLFWEYFNFLLSIRIKKDLELTSEEHYVSKMMKERKLTWLPVHKSRYLGITHFDIENKEKTKIEESKAKINEKLTDRFNMTLNNIEKEIERLLDNSQQKFEKDHNIQISHRAESIPL